ncbi:MAG TPA: DUF4386 domain-containing protein [Candidatus Limnocylindria bacterium]|nr:DUF4386 domain-containing protein [Candidatus Limnocylindria bacterium]
MSTKQHARFAGVLYLIVAIFGGFAHLIVRAQVYVPGDAAATAQSVVTNSGLVRAGVVADLFQATVFLFLGMALYQLLKHVNVGAGRAMVILVAIATTIICLNMVFQFAALLVATNGAYVAAFGAAGASALVLLLLDIQHYGYLIAQIFFGLWLVPLGYLAYRSGMFPRALGVLLIAGGISYVVDMLVLFLFPGFGETISAVVIIPPAVAELWMVAYLLTKGVRAQRRDERPAATVRGHAATTA